MYEKKRIKPISKWIEEAKITLQATDKQMCRHLRLSVADYEALRSGARVLPLPSQKTLIRRIEGLYEVCGLQTSK